MNKKLILSILICFFLIGKAGFSNTTRIPQFEWTPGEELIYSVKWSFITLGHLRLQVLKSDTLRGHHVYHCRIYLESNPSVPFVHINDMYDSFIDADSVYSRMFLSYEKKDDHTLFTKYDFDYDKNQVHIRIEKHKDREVEIVKDSTGTVPDKVQDSLSLLFFARVMSVVDKVLDVNAFIYNKYESTQINCSGNEQVIDANDQEVAGYYLDGRLKFVGIAGIKDDFKGWFSTDAQRVPLKAYMKAFVGKVTVELEEWKNWNGDQIFKKNDEE